MFKELFLALAVLMLSACGAKITGTYVGQGPFALSSFTFKDDGKVVIQNIGIKTEVPYVAQAHLGDILCEQHERVVGNDNTVRFEGLILQVPEQEIRYSYSRTTVRVHRCVDGSLSVWHGPRLLERFDAQGIASQTTAMQTPILRAA